MAEPETKRGLDLNLSFKLKLPSPGPPFEAVAFFPWGAQDLADLWKGEYNKEPYIHTWASTISSYKPVFAAASKTHACIFSSQNPAIQPLDLRLSDQVQSADGWTTQIAWALNPTSLSPFLLIAVDRKVLVIDTRNQSVSGLLRGHGGTITSIAVHLTSPHIFCTTSKDFTTRIYDLTRSATEPSTNLHWAPDPRPSGAGLPFGLRAVEPEGHDQGLCTTVLVGGKSGGHRAAVLGAAFHPVLPVLATCGSDRALKIWYVRPRNTKTLVREDKPLFSTTKIHQASVGSLVWLGREHLLSHCATPVFRACEGEETILKTGKGTLVIWEWLAMDRFFPPEHVDSWQDVLRGSASEYQDSSSLKVIAEYAFEQQLKPNVIPRIHSCSRGEPRISYTYPGSHAIQVVGLASARPRKKPSFSDQGELAPPDQDALRRHLNIEPLANLGCIQLSIPPEEGSFHACAMGPDGDIVAGAGCAGSEAVIWVWHKRPL
ncbi:hypothetical protein BDN71DRAFT_1446572 [Pleurotus eryngii]|uniref:WD40 repeat-like protein n=1 Tax=Pleurotus eryngii TaxID=5323 RepID=A0A9P5ZXK3_PLEER|nr:hypothetical protein BDN71DRAFT_1446572 [Pleurotus eryngii]